jgi:uncharacterized protein YlxW (UPF0749 family)
MTAPLAAPPGPLTRFRGFAGGSLALALAAGVVGFLLVGQLQGPRRASPPLAAESESDLARILSDLNSEADALQNEIAELKVQLNELRRSSQDETAAAQAANEQLRSLEVLAGTVAVTGPGVAVSITDPNGLLNYDTMIDVVQELRDAGAEAVAIDDRRIGVATAFGERDGKITVDGVVVTQPYRVTAIGQASTLDGGLKIPGGAVDAVSAVKGVRIDVSRQAKVDIPALANPPQFKVAKPSGK